MSTELKSLPIDKIFIDPERIRTVDEDVALAIQSEIVESGFADPILVRRTPRRSEQPYTLIDGAHRMRAVQLLDESEILAVVVDADKDTAEMLEAGQNLFRHLSALDQALSINAYRTAWERKHGKINSQGGRPKNSANIAQFGASDQSAKFALCPIDIVSDEAARGFSVQCAERLGMSKRSIELSVRIAKGLIRTLVECLRSTPHADNQSTLLKLASLDEQQQEAIVGWVTSGEKTLDEAIKMGARMVGVPGTEPPITEGEEQNREFDIAISGFSRLNRQDRISAIIGYWKADEKALRAGLKKLGFDIVPLGASK